MTMIRNTIAATLALATLASPAFAAERTAAASSSRNASAAVTRSDETPSPDQRVCASFVPTGSMIRRSVCHDRSEWDRRYGEVPGEEGR